MLDFSRLRLLIGNKRYSSWSQRGWLAAKLSGLPFEEDVLPMRLEGFEDAKAKGRLPAGQVPVLFVGDVMVWDSQAILETLGEREPARFWPADPRARALARCVVAEMHAGFADLRRTLPAIYGPKLPTPDLPGTVRSQIARIEHLWALCRAQATPHGPFLFGPFSAADCFYAPVVTRFDAYGVTVSPETRAYMDAVLAHDWVRQWYADAAAEEWRIDDYEPKP